MHKAYIPQASFSTGTNSDSI